MNSRRWDGGLAEQPRASVTTARCDSLAFIFLLVDACGHGFTTGIAYGVALDCGSWMTHSEPGTTLFPSACIPRGLGVVMPAARFCESLHGVATRPHTLKPASPSTAHRKSCFQTTLLCGTRTGCFQEVSWHARDARILTPRCQARIPPWPVLTQPQILQTCRVVSSPVRSRSQIQVACLAT
jgi:hypothetical protein